MNIYRTTQIKEELIYKYSENLELLAVYESWKYKHSVVLEC